MDVMEIKTQDETTIRKYLLGELSIEDMQEIELWLMTDDGAMDLINAAEDDLIDESLAGELKGKDLGKFESHFLAAPERQKKYQFSKTLHRRLRPDSNPKVRESEKPNRKSVWTVIRGWFQYRLELGYAVPAMVVILTAGILYHQKVTSEVVSIQGQRDGIQLTLNNTKKDLEDQRSINSNQGQLEIVPLIGGPLAKTRTTKTLRVIQVKSESELIYLDMDLPDGRSQNYRAELYVGDNKEPIRTWNRIRIVVDGTHRIARIIEAGVNLPTGELSLSLSEDSPSPASDTLVYRFIVSR
jgi:anti-sigma-K factor RskA